MNSQTTDEMKRFDDGSVIRNEGRIMESLANEGGGIAKVLGKSKNKGSLARGPGGPRRGSKKREHGSPMMRRRRR